MRKPDIKYKESVQSFEMLETPRSLTSEPLAAELSIGKQDVTMQNVKKYMYLKLCLSFANLVMRPLDCEMFYYR